MMGIAYPLIYELAYDQKISVGAPFYNAIYAPVTVLASIILIISIESKWGRSFKKIQKFNQLNLSLALSLVAAISLYFYANNGSVIIYISAFVGFLLLIRYLILLVFNTFQKKHINISSMLAHMGLGMLILSVSANSIFSSERVFNMYPNDIKTYRNISISFDDLQLINNSNHDSIRAVFKVVDSNGKSSFLYPEKRKYFVRGQITSETAIKVTPLKDIYITIGDQLDNKSWVVNVQLNYFIRYVWLSAIMMALSGLIIVISSYRSKS
jgi:cytochrome c-type biogenesis protein CcmF